MTSRNFQIIYLLPNLFTAASIFTAIISIVAAINGNFEKSVWLIFLSLLFDGIDGRIARLTDTTSKFGVEFDSLADIVAFGVAPAILLYFYVGYEYGKLGTLVMALYIIFGAIRLARFNVNVSNIDPAVFIGIPIPAAAMFVSVWVLMFLKYDFLSKYSWILLLGAFFISILMVSNIRYPSFKKINLKRSMLIKILIVFIIFTSLFYLYPVEGFAIMITSYTLFGLARTIYALAKIKKV